MPATTVHLVDASPYIFRSFFVMPSSMVDPEGRPVGAVHGFASFLLKLIDGEDPSHLGVAFDESLSTSFRNDRYPEYKAQRELPPPELEAQQKACQDVARALGAVVWVSERYEADDLIGTALAQLPKKTGAVIVSSDKDLAQLVNERVTFYDFARDRKFGPSEVVDKFGVRPDQLVDLLALAGDSVDNIPGVRGVGQKTAAALLQARENLDALYADLAAVEELPLRGARSVAKKLDASRADAFLSRELATVARDAPIEVTLDDLAYQGADPELVTQTFDRLGFDTLRDRIRRWRS